MLDARKMTVTIVLLYIGLTFLFTFLLTALLAVIVGVIAVAVARKRCQKHATEQVPANNVTQNVYGSHEYLFCIHHSLTRRFF